MVAEDVSVISRYFPETKSRWNIRCRLFMYLLGENT